MKQHLFYLLCIFSVWQLKAQESSNILPNYSVDRNVKEYSSVAGGQAIIYTGKEEMRYPSNVIGHPYLFTSDYKTGILAFDGVVYPDVRLRLNLHNEELVVLSPDDRFNVIVPTNRVEYAILEDKYYIFYNVPENGISNLSKGYYVRLHDGKYPILKRETCFMQSSIKEMRIEISFVRKNRLYIFKDGIYNPIANKRALLKLFKNQKKQLKEFIKKKDLNFRQSLDEAVVSVTEYYETLSL